MPAHPRKIQRYGWKRDLPDIRDRRFQAIIPRMPLPPRQMLSHPLPAFDQGQLGSCTANATVGAITFDENVQTPSSAVEMESRLFLYYWSRFLEGSQDQDSGASLRDVMKAYNQYGICSEQEYPYDITLFASQPTMQGECRPVHYASVEQNPFAVKRTLLSGFPVIFGFTVYTNFESQETASSGFLTMPKVDTGEDYPIGGHAVLMMGYDDNQTFPDGSQGGVFVRNSWGTGWGQSGYFWMPYDMVFSPSYADDFWVIDKISTPQA